jgi:Bacterial Ig domain
VLVTAPAHGTVVLAADGSYTYTAYAGFFGTDAFTYAASDGSALSNPVTITIVVAAEAPVRPIDPPRTPDAPGVPTPLAPAPAGDLPVTGSGTTPLHLAVAMIIAGLVTLAVGRRRRVHR